VFGSKTENAWLVQGGLDFTKGNKQQTWAFLNDLYIHAYKSSVFKNKENFKTT